MFLLPMVEAKPSFDRDKDFMPVSLLARSRNLRRYRPRGMLRILPAWSPGSRPTYQGVVGVPSNGTIWHFAGSRPRKYWILLTRVSYRGTTPIINDLLGGHLPFAVITAADAIPHRSGGIKICREQ
jgi:tripartite-type tricarboxylate transporter receptor subunit TctC